MPAGALSFRSLTQFSGLSTFEPSLSSLRPAICVSRPSTLKAERGAPIVAHSGSKLILRCFQGMLSDRLVGKGSGH